MRETSEGVALAGRSAERLMSFKIPTLPLSATIGDAQQLLYERTKGWDSIDYLYVLDGQRRLRGVMSIKEVFRQPAALPVVGAMVPDPVTVRPHTHQERVVHLALKHNIKSVPVVDQDGVLLGVVLNDSILQTLYAETSEDLLRLAGIDHRATHFDVVNKMPLLKLLWHRFPWLAVGLAGGFAAAGIIGRFQGTLEQHVVLAVFIPLVVYMASAVGMQMEAFAIRDLAFNPALIFKRYFTRQALVTAALAVILGAAVYGLITALYEPAVAAAVAIALTIAICSSVVTGLAIPYAFQRLRFDPAYASGPIATIIQDILSVSIYFGVATWLL